VQKDNAVHKLHKSTEDIPFKDITTIDENLSILSTMGFIRATPYLPTNF
jgi:hypothetical protein